MVANYGSLGAGAITVLRNTTAGRGQLSFAAPAHFAGGSGAEGMTVADLNGDHKPDVISGNTAGNDVTAMVNQTPRGSGKIRLAAPQRFPATAGPTAVIAADLNADGRLDLAVGSSFTVDPKALTVLLNQTPTGSATLRFAGHTFEADAGIEGITAADFDGDGRPDLAAGNALASGQGGIAILINQTPTAASPPQRVTGRAKCRARKSLRRRARTTCTIRMTGTTDGMLDARLTRRRHTLAKARGPIRNGKATLRFARRGAFPRQATLTLTAPTATGRRTIRITVQIRPARVGRQSTALSRALR